jgi:ubiquinone/menaquinone biosynthesis C-methylase UbiE
MSAAADGTQSWPQIAVWYDRLLAGGSPQHELAVATTLRLAGDIRGARVLDLACGQGMAARALAKAGAVAVTGVDATAEMIDAARRQEAAAPLGIRYLVDDAQVLGQLGGAVFDLVTCQLALMDIPDLAAVLTAAARALRASGSLVFVIGHPCFLAPDAVTVETSSGRPGRLIADYLTERFWRSANPAGVRRAGTYHRTLSTYLNALLASGFVLEAVEEPTAGDALAAQQPVYAGVPIFFAGRAVRR